MVTCTAPGQHSKTRLWMNKLSLNFSFHWSLPVVTRTKWQQLVYVPNHTCVLLSVLELYCLITHQRRLWRFCNRDHIPLTFAVHYFDPYVVSPAQLCRRMLCICVLAKCCWWREIKGTMWGWHGVSQRLLMKWFLRFSQECVSGISLDG